ncbi:hypothetical protein KMZ29_20775 [Bradyrhizobium sediminis]|uniref:Uncharacterized protein n=1 Tax=Bradyrhizobium sediminis TaxID=2840469 RepID=A0A975RL40_9BRAD|nr:hypothetical protein [Bradyrhizobium sediminis]QWG12132.1 hypothetical protein KMZ29_20775 [Bradyrhizobium sediminis]
MAGIFLAIFSRKQFCMPAFFTIFVDAIFTTLFERLFTKVFDVIAQTAAISCMYRACNAG